jgi:hypothetical protein
MLARTAFTAPDEPDAKINVAFTLQDLHPLCKSNGVINHDHSRCLKRLSAHTAPIDVRGLGLSAGEADNFLCRELGSAALFPLPPLTGTWYKDHMKVRSAAICLVAIGCLTLVSCIDLTAVTQLAKDSADTGNALKSILNVGLASCMEVNGFRPKNDPRPCDKLYGKSVQDPIQKMGDSLFTYVGALGKLAGANVSAFQAGSVKKDLAAAGADAPTQAKADAAEKLVGAVTNIFLAHYRQGKLTRIIGDHDVHVQAVAAFLKDWVVDTKYALEFESQKTVVTAECMKLATDHPNELVGRWLLERSCNQERATIQARLDALTRFKLAIDAIAGAHHKLATSRKEWTATELALLIGPEVQQLNTSVQAVQTAFAK